MNLLQKDTHKESLVVLKKRNRNDSFIIKNKILATFSTIPKNVSRMYQEII